MSPGEDFHEYVKNLNVPVLDIKTRQGWTDYIDFIKPDELTSTIMKGVDKFGRPFLVVKGKGISGDNSDTEIFQTFFQRYQNNQSLWMGCGHYGINFFETAGGMTAKHFNAIKDLIDGKSVSSEDFYRSDSKKFDSYRLQ